ncbi:MAG: hypothetical protein QXM31_01260 [Candidatus Woesearchaeota archaeon]
MSMDGIGMMSAPRRQLYRQNSATSLLRDFYDGNSLYFANRRIEPADNIEGLYAKAFKEVVDSLPKEAIKITQTRLPFDLYLCATNRNTGKSVIMHAKTCEVGPYCAKVHLRQDGKIQYLNWLMSNEHNRLMAQYKGLKERIASQLK